MLVVGLRAPHRNGTRCVRRARPDVRVAFQEQGFVVAFIRKGHNGRSIARVASDMIGSLIVAQDARVVEPEEPIRIDRWPAAYFGFKMLSRDGPPSRDQASTPASCACADRTC